MKLIRALPILLGVAIVLLGVYLVSSHGSIAGVNIPTLLGFPQCDTSSNATPCLGVGLYGGVGVGTVVVLFGLGILAASIRSGVMAASMGGGPSMGGIPPEFLATLQHAQSRMQAPAWSGTASPPPGTMDPSAKYCSKCGTRTEASSRFCKSCGTPF